MSRAAASPGGLRNTEPALAPPGWCSVRQRTISAQLGPQRLRVARAPRGSRARDHDVVVGERRVAVAEGERTERPHRRRRRRRRGRRRWRRRAPRPSPGRDRRRSSAPRRRPSPGCRRRTRARPGPRPRTGGRAPAARSRRRRRPCRRRRAIVLERGAEHHDHAGEAGVGDEQVRAAAEDEAGHVAGQRRREDREVGRRASTRTSTAAGPPTRQVVSAPNGASVSTRPGQPRRELGRERVRARPRQSPARATASSSSGRLVMSPPPRVRTTSPGAREPRDELGELAAVRDVREALVGVRVEHRVHEELAGDPGDRRLVEAAHVGEHHLVGTDERVGELRPHDRGARVAERLEHRDDPPVPGLARGDDRGVDLGREQRVVVDDRDAVDLAAVLEAAGHAAEAARARAAPRRSRTRAPSSPRPRRPRSGRGAGR